MMFAVLTFAVPPTELAAADVTVALNWSQSVSLAVPVAIPASSVATTTWPGVQVKTWPAMTGFSDVPGNAGALPLVRRHELLAAR